MVRRHLQVTASRDPRLFQLAFLAGLLAAGMLWRGFAVGPAQVVATFAGGLLAQALGLRLLRLEGVGYRSAAITCLSLCLLLRTDRLWVAFTCAAAANGGKFLLRAGGKHLWNPGNLGVVVGLLLTSHAWVSPAQWGHDLTLAAWLALLGATVVWRANRVDVSWAFLGFYLGLIALRVLWLGQRPAVLLHQLENGSLLLFSFFMISDPKTIPDGRPGRLLLAGLCALAAFAWQYVFFRTNGLFYALFALTPLTPLWDRLWRGEAYRWDAPRALPLPPAPREPEGGLRPVSCAPRPCPAGTS